MALVRGCRVNGEPKDMEIYNLYQKNFSMQKFH